MDESMWERYGATAGVIAVVLLMGSLFLTSAPPHIDASVDKITTFFGDHRKALLTEQVLGTFGVVFFVWFVGHLRHVLERAEGGAEALSPIVYGSGIALAAAGAVTVLPMTILAFSANQTEVMQNAGLVRALYNGNAVALAIMMILSGMFVAATGYAMVRKEMVAPWLGWAGLAVALVNWIVGAEAFYQTTYNSFWNTAGYVGFLGFALFVLLTSIQMVRQPEATRRTAPTPVFGS